MNDDKTAQAKPRRIGLWLGLVAVAGLAAGAVYGTLGAPDNAQGASCPDSAAVAARVGPLAKGEVAALNVSAKPVPAPAMSFKRPDGTAATMADFKGRAVLLNLWATWCIPCRAEMPALDALQKELGSKDFEVVAVNLDQRNPERVASFLEEIKVGALARYADPSNGVLSALKNEGLALGLPTTVLIDRDGCRIGVMQGPAEWASDDARALIKAAIGG